MKKSSTSSFFDVSKIKHEGPSSKNPLAFKPFFRGLFQPPLERRDCFPYLNPDTAFSLPLALVFQDAKRYPKI